MAASAWLRICRKGFVSITRSAPVSHSLWSPFLFLFFQTSPEECRDRCFLVLGDDYQIFTLVASDCYCALSCGFPFPEPSQGSAVYAFNGGECPAGSSPCDSTPEVMVGPNLVELLSTGPGASGCGSFNNATVFEFIANTSGSYTFSACE
jgi:hypothetical protein